MKIVYKFLFVLAFAFISTAIFTWPYVTVLDKFYYDRGDFPVSGAIFSYNEYSLRTGRIFDQEKYFNGFQFYPQPFTMAYSDLRLFPSLIYSPIFWITKNFILSVNLITFLTFILSFISSYFVINYFIKKSLAALIGALVFTFNPMTFSRFPEHFELLNKYFLPLIFLAAYKFVEKPSFKKGFYLGLTFTLNGLSVVYYQLLSLILLPIFILPIFFYKPKKETWLNFINLLKNITPALLFLPLILYFYLPFNQFSKLEMTNRVIEDVAYNSARLIDFISSNKTNYLYGTMVTNLDLYREPKDNSSKFNYLEHTLFPTVFPTFLFVIGIWSLLKTKSIEDKRFLIPFLLVFFVALVLSFGPYFQGWNNKTSDWPFPYLFFYNVFEFMKGMRAPTRVLFFALVPFSLFAAIGFCYLQKILKQKVVLFLIALALIFTENFNFDGAIVSFQERSVTVPQVEKLFNTNKLPSFENKKTIHLPPLAGYVGYASAYLNWSALTHEIIANGNSGYLLSDQLLFLNQLGKLDKLAFDKMTILGFDYLILHKNLKDDFFSWDKVNKNSLGNVIYEDPDLVVIDMKNWKDKPKICDFDKNLTKEFRLFNLENSLETIEALEVNNDNDCYYPAIYQDKYKTLRLSKRDFYGNFLETNFQYKLPVVIEPRNKVILSKVFGNLSSGI